MRNVNLAEYIWLDGNQPTQGIRSKARVVQVPSDPTPADFPVLELRRLLHGTGRR